MTVRVEVLKVTDLVPDPENANVGTARGLGMIEESVAENGAGRSLLASADGVLLAGNKTQQALVNRGVEEVIAVHTDGMRAVVVVRDDVESGTDRAKRLALADNRANEVGLEWDPQVLAGLDIDLDEYFSPYEQAQIGLDVEVPDFDPMDEWKGMPEFENEDVFGAVLSLKVHFASENDVQRFSELVGQDVTMQSKYIWFPKQERMDLKSYRVIDDES